MDLEKGVILSLWNNNIWDEGARAIMENMELKEGVTLNLGKNNISKNMMQKLREWNQSYIRRWINCRVVV